MPDPTPESGRGATLTLVTGNTTQGVIKLARITLELVTKTNNTNINNCPVFLFLLTAQFKFQLREQSYLGSLLSLTGTQA